MTSQDEAPGPDPIDWPVPTLAALTALAPGEVEDAILVARARRARVAFDAAPFAPTQARMVEMARSWQGAGSRYPESDVDPATLAWRYEPGFPVARLLALMGPGGAAAWAEWFAGECRCSVEDGRAGYADLLLETVEEPVVLVELPDGRLDVWDGWHRVGATVVGRRPGVPTIVGRMAAAGG